MSTSRKFRGMFLIELVLYIALATLVLGTSAGLYMVILSQENHALAVKEVDENASMVLHTIAQNLREAKAVSEPLHGENSAELYVINQEDAVVPTSTYTRSSEGVVSVREGSSSETVLTEKDVVVDSILFENLSNSDASDSVRITLVASYANAGGRPEFEYSNTYHMTVTTHK